jgi:hypothetical protein
MVGIFDPACELLPPWTNCCPSTFSLTSPSLPLPKLNVHAVYTDRVWLGGGGVLNCVVEHILQEFYTQSPYFKTFMEPRNRFKGMNSASLCSLVGRYDNPIPPRFIAPIDSLKIPALFLTRFRTNKIASPPQTKMTSKDDI